MTISNLLIIDLNLRKICMEHRFVIFDFDQQEESVVIDIAMFSHPVYIQT